MKPRQEAETDKMWKLKATVYGLCDASRVWYLSVKGVLLKAGAVKSKFDDSVFYWQKDGKLEELISCHVDDFFWGGTKCFEISVIDVLKKSFVTSQEELRSFKYVGLNIEQRQGCIYLDQLMYTDELKEADVSRERRMSKESPLTTQEARQLRGLAGQLNWTSSQTRPDMSFGACEVSVSIKDSTVNDLIVANKNMRKLKSEKVVLQYPNLGNIELCSIICFSDAAFANLKNGSSQGGFIIFLCKSDKNYAPISWKSRKIQRVVRSTLAAETLAMKEALEECFIIRSMLLEIYKRDAKSGLFAIYCYTDSKLLLESVHSTKTLKEKRLKVDVCVILEMLEKKEIESINWCPSNRQLADCLTKSSVSSTKLMSVLKRESGILKPLD